MKGLLDSEHIQSLVKEESVRGVLVRSVLAEAQDAGSAELALLERSLQLLLERFQQMEGNGP